MDIGTELQYHFQITFHLDVAVRAGGRARGRAVVGVDMFTVVVEYRVKWLNS